jgi:hypothetical protein
VSGVRGGGGFFEEVFVSSHFVTFIYDQSEPSSHTGRGRERRRERIRERMRMMWKKGRQERGGEEGVGRGQEGRGEKRGVSKGRRGEEGRTAQQYSKCRTARKHSL